ncbi:MAG: ABC transporter permease [Idiomarina sp.]
MIAYYFKLALLSLRRNLLLTALMIAAIGLGIGAAMTTITVNYLMSANPIPHKSDQLFYVQVDSWDPNQPYTEPNEPPDQVTWTEATNLTAAKQAKRQSAIATSFAVIEPERAEQKPFIASIRLAYSDFFPMFDVPFLYGSGWQESADQDLRRVVVLSKKMNDEIFGGEDSVGRNLIMAGTSFQVVGVLDNWELKPKFFDVTTGAFDEMEDVYVPFLLKQAMELPSSGNNNCWKPYEEGGFSAYLSSECINYQMWVELDSDAAKADYQSFLHSYVEEQKRLGRFPREQNNRLSDVMQWMENQEVVAEDARMMMYMALMFLVVCLLNTVALLLAKFIGRTPEIALRRAVGASKRTLFLQHIIESAMLGVAGGILGLAIAWLGLQGVSGLYGEDTKGLAELDLTMAALAVVLAIVSTVLAGIYPNWRTCSVAPAGQLKTQ